MNIHTQIDQAEQDVIDSLNAVRQLLHNQNRVLRFGTWADWGVEDIRYLLEELQSGHWDDCSGTVPGYVLATDALGIVLELDFPQREQEEIVFSGIRLLADTMTCFTEEEDSRDLCEQITALVEAYCAERQAKTQEVGVQ
ncbi:MULTISPECIES: hypothetical protein [Gammaproteobacteria]|uniref:hypothetical protein n=1 Tax=Gammaproteobacteria TaxID=1236 RepID=UPI003A930AE8